MRIMKYLTVFLVHQCFLQISAKEPANYDWCETDEALTLEGCRNIAGDMVDMSILQNGTVCTLIRGRQAFLASCIEGAIIVADKQERLYRKQRSENGSATASNPAASVGGFTSVGAAIGSAFGPIGTAVGAGIGMIADIVCNIFCHHDKPPPPNTPPQITKPAALSMGTPIFAEEGKTTAKVSWTEPEITDKENGKLQAVAYVPSNLKNGGDFPEGNFVVYFVGTDKGGLSVTGFLSFEVKVQRCAFQRWPENGKIDCNGTDTIYGSSCTVKCKRGYVLDEGDSPTVKCGKHGSWMPPSPPDCKPRACAKPPTFANGELQCLNNKMVFDNLCEAVCNDGYQVHGMHLMGCDESGQWGSPPVCRDAMPPRFLSGECPDDMQIYVDSPNNTAQAVWDIPKGIDNSKQSVTITETHGYAPGKRLSAGAHTVKYTIEDAEHNFGDSCVFSIQVMSLSCPPPSLNVVGADHLKYDCPASYTIGAKCSLACKSGYPMGGARQIQCSMEKDSYPPKLNWEWESGALSPFCKETNCSRDALNEPLHGALACSEWTHGQMCQMQCESGFDIPNIGDGQYVCGRSTGLWRPSSKVPDCDTKIDVNHMHLPNEFYYYTGKCNSSADNLLQIQENFVKALNASKFLEECVGVPECQAKYVDVTCGPVSSRKRRDTYDGIARRSAVKIAYTLRFQISLPFKQIPGKTADDIFTENKNRLNRMSDVIQNEVDSGHFDLHIGDLHVDSNSYGPGSPEMVCPNGTIPRKETGSCVGCPKGSYSDGGRCKECPVGFYQDITNSQSCKQCPPNTNTTEAGAYNITQCQAYCMKGEFSPNGLAPCTKCETNSYQPNTRATSCLKCNSNQRTSAPGAGLQTQCQVFDVQTGQVPTQIKVLRDLDKMTIFMWARIANSYPNDVAIVLQKTSSVADVTLKLHPTMAIAQARSAENNIGTTLATGKWLTVALTMDKRSNEIKVFVGGKQVYGNTSFTFTSSHILEANDTLQIQGAMTFSALYVLPSVATLSDIIRWSSNCMPAITGALISMDDISEAENVKIVTPSVCDALDECDSSPCGKFECINKLGGYECKCDGGYSGLQCQDPPDFCKNNNCQNGATCVNGSTNYTCNCAYRFHGDLCEIKAVDGQWSIWTEWTGCSKSCGGGVMLRNRRCDSPPPDPEGVICAGNDRETKTCEEQKCPECDNLRRTYGLTITCNETSELRHCIITCRPGLYFTTPPLPYYECGVATGYKWNNQNEENPTARLPTCSELKPPSELGVNFEGRYDSLPCTDKNMQTVKENIQLKMQLLDCKMNGTCETMIHDPVCKDSTKKRSVGSSMLVTVGIHARVGNNGDPLDVAALLQNHTAATPGLVDLVRQTLELERTAQKIMNNSIDFFQVTVDGRQHSVGSSQLTFKPAIVCPGGTIRLEVFCAESPEGSYSDGRVIVMCPRGEYQDIKGQSSCKQCPEGMTTLGIGSVHVSECSVNVRKFDIDNTRENGANAIQIGIGVSVSVGFLVMSVVAITFACKYVKKRKSKVNDSAIELQISGIFDMQSKPAFSKHPYYD